MYISHSVMEGQRHSNPLRPKKNIVVSGNMDKKIGSVGRFFFYNGAYKYTKLLHTFLSFCLLVTLYFDMFCYRKNDLDMMISSWNCNKTVCLKTSPIEIEPEKNSAQISP